MSQTRVEQKLGQRIASKRVAMAWRNGSANYLSSVVTSHSIDLHGCSQHYCLLDTTICVYICLYVYTCTVITVFIYSVGQYPCVQDISVETQKH